jgi:hypothetical protein
MKTKRRTAYIDSAACMTIVWPTRADEGTAHCPRTHHALGAIYIPPSGGWNWITFGENPQRGDADSEREAIRKIRLQWGLY